MPFSLGGWAYLFSSCRSVLRCYCSKLAWVKLTNLFLQWWAPSHYYFLTTGRVAFLSPSETLLFHLWRPLYTLELPAWHCSPYPPLLSREAVQVHCVWLHGSPEATSAAAHGAARLLQGKGVGGGRGNSDWTHGTLGIPFAFQPFSCHVSSLFCAPLFRSIVVLYGETSSRNSVQEDANRRQSMHLLLKTGANWEESTGSGHVSMPSDLGVLQVHWLVKQVW